MRAGRTSCTSKRRRRSPSQGRRNTEEIAILRKLVKKAPQDIEARIFLAEAVGDGYDDKGEPKAGRRSGLRFLESVLKDAPNDSAANHYWIHADGAGQSSGAGIEERGAAGEPGAELGAHGAHAGAHLLSRTGNYAEAEHWFAASMEADERYLREQHVSPDDDWNYVHNMMYAIANLMEQGKLPRRTR
jgi:hypothetical protein